MCGQFLDSAMTVTTLWGPVQGYCGDSAGSLRKVWGQCMNRSGTVLDIAETLLGPCMNSVGTVQAQCIDSSWTVRRHFRYSARKVLEQGESSVGTVLGHYGDIDSTGQGQCADIVETLLGHCRERDRLCQESAGPVWVLTGDL